MRWITRDFWAKASSVFLAILLWFYVSGEQGIEVTHDIPVRLDLPEDFLLVDINSPTLSITFKGGQSIVQDMDFERVVYARDLREGAQPGKITFVVSAADLVIPRFLSVVSMSPREITAVIDRLTEKELTVEPQLTGRPSDGFKVDGVSVNPSAINARGPVSKLRRSSRVVTEDVDLTGRNRSFFQKVPVQSMVPGERSDTMVEVYVRIREEVEEKVFDNHAIRVLQSVEGAWNAQLEPAAATVVVGGNKEVLGRVTAPQISLFLDLSDLAPGDYELPIQSSAPKQVRILKIEPSTAKVKARGITTTSAVTPVP